VSNGFWPLRLGISGQDTELEVDERERAAASIERDVSWERERVGHTLNVSM